MKVHTFARSALASAFLALAGCPAPAQTPTWDAHVAISPVVMPGTQVPSSSRLHIAWTSLPGAVRVGLEVTESRGTRIVEVPASTDRVELSGLKAATVYTVGVLACLDEGCGEVVRSRQTAVATTSAEYWRINGNGRGYGNAARLVPDGNVGSYAFRYGPWAGPALDGRLQLYYNPLQREEKGAKIAEPVAGRITAIGDAAEFRGVSGFGLLRLCNPDCAGDAGIATRLALFQAVPLAGANRVRLYFEAEGSDRRTRIMSLDSQDGYAGRDFHRGASTRCETFADYGRGGGCEPTLEIGVDIDGARGYASIRHARQFKIAYPTRESWAWDMSPGTPMFFTTEWNDGRCSAFGFNAAYAVWSGTRWVVQDDGQGCPKMLKGAQAPAPVHLGGARYKVYFNRHRQPSGVVDPRLAAKPVQMLYADGAVSGDPTVVDFEDWESMEAARDVHYVWADGSLLTEDEESRLDDYVVFAPTEDAERLIMYSNMSATGTTALPFIGSAVLINP